VSRYGHTEFKKTPRLRIKTRTSSSMEKNNIKKIALVGCAGSGKTTLASQLKEIFNLPLYHLDKYYWKPHWQRADFDEFCKSHNELCLKDEWIIEGSYIRTLYERIEHADIIIFLDMPRYVCLWRVFKRWILNWGNTMPDSPENCPQKLDWTFLKWVWNFNARFRKSILHMLDEYADEKSIYILRSTNDVQSFLEGKLRK